MVIMMFVFGVTFVADIMWRPFFAVSSSVIVRTELRFVSHAMTNEALNRNTVSTWLLAMVLFATKQTIIYITMTLSICNRTCIWLAWYRKVRRAVGMGYGWRGLLGFRLFRVWDFPGPWVRPPGTRDFGGMVPIRFPGWAPGGFRICRTGCWRCWRTLGCWPGCCCRTGNCWYCRAGGCWPRPWCEEGVVCWPLCEECRPIKPRPALFRAFCQNAWENVSSLTSARGPGLVLKGLCSLSCFG